MSNTFLVISMTEWIAQDYRAGLNAAPELAGKVSFVHERGIDLPRVPTEDVVGAWLPAEFAGRLIVSGYRLPWTSPGAHWLSKVEPELLGREVLTVCAGDAIPAEGFWKIAEAKIEGFEGKWRSEDEARDFLSALPPGAFVQYTSTYLDIVSEERFFVYEGDFGEFFMTHSTYATEGWTYYDDLEERIDANPQVTALVVDNLLTWSQFSPAGYVVDIATLRDGRVVVLEANPVWSSAAYACDMSEVIRANMTAMRPENTGRCPWVPDNIIMEREQKKRLLR